MYIPVMYKISGMFMITYPDLYKIVRCKLLLFAILFEIIIILKAVNYLYVQFLPITDRHRAIEIASYVIENVIILGISYMIYKNN